MLSLMEQEKHKIDREGVQALVLCCGTLGIAPASLAVSWLCNVGFGSGDECPWVPLMFQPCANPEILSVAFLAMLPCILSCILGWTRGITSWLREDPTLAGPRTALHREVGEIWVPGQLSSWGRLTALASPAVGIQLLGAQSPC